MKDKLPLDRTGFGSFLDRHCGSDLAEAIVPEKFTSKDTSSIGSCNSSHTERIPRLGICSVCEKIRIHDAGDDNPNSWIGEKDCPQVYHQMRVWYEGSLTHSYCPPCLDKFMEENK